VHAEDVRMLQARGDLDLLREARGAECGGEIGTQDLDRHLAVVLEVFGEIHRSHATGAEFALDAVPAGERGVQAGDGVSHEAEPRVCWGTDLLFAKRLEVSEILLAPGGALVRDEGGATHERYANITVQRDHAYRQVATSRRHGENLPRRARVQQGGLARAGHRLAASTARFISFTQPGTTRT